jgi:hypothetical protein
MKQRVNRAQYFLRDGQYFPIMFNRVADDSPVKAVTNPLLSELHFYDNNDGENFPGGHFDIYGFPPEPESFVKQAAWDEEVARNGGEKKSPPVGFTKDQVDALVGGGYTKDQVDEIVESMSGPKRDVVSHYTVGEIETIDFIFDKLGYEGGLAYVIGNLIKYPARANHKGCRRSDITKIRNYATIALEHMDKNGELE